MKILPCKKIPLILYIHLNNNICTSQDSITENFYSKMNFFHHLHHFTIWTRTISGLYIHPIKCDGGEVSLWALHIVCRQHLVGITVCADK